MADYAIGLSFHKAHRTIVRVVELTPPCRYFATRDASGFITLPTLETGSRYIELQGIKQTSFQVNDTSSDFRLLGDDGWSDGVITGSSVQASMNTYFMKNTEIVAGANCPTFRGDYEEGFKVIEKSRYNKSYEVYIEFLKEMGQAEGSSGNYIYDFTGFNATIQNYQDPVNPEGLSEISFNLQSRGRPVFGRYDAGSTAITFGGVQTGLLFLTPGTRQAAVVPVDNASAVVVSAPLTVTYTSNGSIALTQLALANSGAGFRLENASSGVKIPAAVTLGGGGSNVVTITPTANLPAATIFRLRVADGAITQAVDGTGTASPTGVKTSIQGLTTTFRTA